MKVKSFMKKRCLPLALAAVMVTGSAPVSVSADNTNDRTWQFESERQIENLNGIITAGQTTVIEDPTERGEGHVLYINGKDHNGQTDYVAFPKELLFNVNEGKYTLAENFSVSFDIYNMATGYRYGFNAGGAEKDKAVYFIPNVGDFSRLEQQGIATDNKDTVVGLNEWHNVAITKTGSKVAVALDGTPLSEITVEATEYDQAFVQIGYSPWVDAGLEAYIDNIHITSDTPYVEPPAEPQMLLWYDFNDGIKDVSGNDNDGTNQGVTVENSEAVFSGDGGYIEMPQGLLAESQAATVSVTFKNQTEDETFKWLWGFGNDVNTNFYFDPSIGWGPGVAAMKHPDFNSGNEEQLICDEGFKKSDEYVTVTVIANGSNSAMYRDGELVRTGRYTVNPSDLGETTLNYIGKSFWSSDVPFTGAVSDFKVYNYALTEKGVIYDLALAQGGDEEALAYLKEWATPTAVAHVNKSLELKTADYLNDGFGITWTSKNPELITADGMVTRPEQGDAEATLVMHIEYKGTNLRLRYPCYGTG